MSTTESSAKVQEARSQDAESKEQMVPQNPSVDLIDVDSEDDVIPNPVTFGKRTSTSKPGNTVLQDTAPAGDIANNLETIIPNTEGKKVTNLGPETSAEKGSKDPTPVPLVSPPVISHMKVTKQVNYKHAKKPEVSWHIA